jgi:hypothetical protein
MKGGLQQFDVKKENLRAPKVNDKYGTDLPKIAPRGLDLCQTELSALGPPSSEKQHRRSSLGRL